MTPDWPYPFWIAHRGAGKQAPENTLAAFRLGLRHGFRAFECDVKLSADGVPFLLHDDTLDRTSTGHGVAGRQDWDHLSRLDAGSWHSALYAGEPLPTLDAIAALARRNQLAINLEIKPSPGQATMTGETVALFAATHWEGAPPPLLSSFQTDALAAARDSAPDLPRALLLDALRDGWLAEAQRLGCVALVIDHRLLDARVIADVHAAGLRVGTYTVNEPARAEQLRQAGLDSLITDNVLDFGPSAAAEGR
jgi:glycerophosphoryl diester phosphodiesterase